MTYQKHTEQELARLQAYMQEYGFTICEESNDSEDDQTYNPSSFSLQDVYTTMQGMSPRQHGSRTEKAVEPCSRECALVAALRRIANQDYRGNRSTESGIAWKALQEHSRMLKSEVTA